MSLSITIDLSDADLAHFQEAVKRAQSNVTAKSPTEITNAAKQLLIDGEGKLRAEWRKVSVKGHAAEVLAAVEAL